ncbi:MAG: SGNH/GDSL hydrolase family protein [Bacteroidetes bacterium]|nr:SGNH/GDSL hydrolase family protein [Bacteroidota bacterium]
MKLSPVNGRKAIQKAALILVSVLLSFLIAECLLRLFVNESDKYYVWQPNLQHTFYPDTTLFCGVYGSSHFSINASGFRGADFEGEAIRYLCMGGSTTECLYLDDMETWPHLLGDSLNEYHSNEYQIGSIGKSGCTTDEHYLQLKYYVPQLPKVSSVILMVGLNDMLKRLSRDTLYNENVQFTPQMEDSMVRAIFLTHAVSKIWWRNLELFRLVQSLLHRARPVTWEQVQDDRGAIMANWRANRKKASKYIGNLPDMNSALDDWEQMLNLIYAEAERQKIKLCFVTQASLYNASLTDYENGLLWMGGVGDYQHQTHQPYYSPAALDTALQLYNKRLLAFCNSKSNITCIDIASLLPKDTSVFYDDCHFNESGARKVAGAIARSLSHTLQ